MLFFKKDSHRFSAAHAYKVCVPDPAPISLFSHIYQGSSSSSLEADGVGRVAPHVPVTGNHAGKVQRFRSLKTSECTPPSNI